MLPQLKTFFFIVTTIVYEQAAVVQCFLVDPAAVAPPKTNPDYYPRFTVVDAADER
jgi:hypothetical protein